MEELSANFWDGSASRQEAFRVWFHLDPEKVKAKNGNSTE